METRSLTMKKQQLDIHIPGHCSQKRQNGNIDEIDDYLEPRQGSLLSNTTALQTVK